MSSIVTTDGSAGVACISWDCVLLLEKREQDVKMDTIITDKMSGRISLVIFFSFLYGAPRKNISEKMRMKIIIRKVFLRGLGLGHFFGKAINTTLALYACIVSVRGTQWSPDDDFCQFPFVTLVFGIEPQNSDATRSAQRSMNCFNARQFAERARSKISDASLDWDSNGFKSCGPLKFDQAWTQITCGNSYLAVAESVPACKLCLS